MLSFVLGEKDRAIAYSNRCNNLNNKGNYDRASEDCTEAIRLDPAFANAYLNRGVGYARKRQYDRAIADQSAAIRLDPNHALAYQNRGEFRVYIGDRTGGNADIAKAKALGYSK